MRAWNTAAAFAAAALISGCKGGGDEFAPPVPPKAVAFQGKVGKKFARVWKSVDGTSTISLAMDGGLKIDTSERTYSGKSTVHVAGAWVVDGSNLLFRYTNRSEQPIVLKYSAKLLGGELTLSQAGGRLKTVYREVKTLEKLK